MDKLKMQTTNVVDENIKRIGEMFPNCLTERLNAEGRPEIAIDFDQLRQELSKDIVEGQEERYMFTWPDKRNAIRLANAPTTDTLRPCREESVNFDTTQNLYIEGDNLQVLKLLRENYLGKVKMIYIDPPYNTGNDFVYNDDFSQSAGEYMHNSGQEDEEGNRLVANTESNGRFHTDWLNMIYPRLKVAKDLLSEDGVIFISIDDNEEENLRKICNEIYGEHNFLADIIWKHTQQSKNDELHFSRQYNHTLCFCKRIEKLHRFYFSRTEEDNKNYSNPDNDPKGLWRSGDVRSPNFRKTLCFDIIAPNGNIIKAPDNGWRWSEDSIKEKISSGEIVFKKDYSGIIRKIYLCDQEGRTPENLWEGVRFGTTRTAAAVIKSLFDNKQVFDTPKPHELVMRMMEIATIEDSIILDFFSGSATTAHAVMQLNAEDGGKRKFIMVQLPEATDEKSEAYKAGYKNICEIGKERIRRAGKKIKEESPLTTQDLDTGFRVLKLDSSNMQDVYYTPAEFNDRDLFEENIKSDRTDEDLLFQSMIELGIELSAKIVKTEIAGKTVWNVSDGYLLACFDEEVNETTITEVAKLKPSYFIMRDSSLANDNVADNFEQIFDYYSKDTFRRII
ncbi:MAG: site-specific DNA-methyltransferase [Bacteroidaceae bacterium]|nr:site-specific DNA-methyltransferase [Bacteroidaceae bacterium]